MYGHWHLFSHIRIACSVLWNPLSSILIQRYTTAPTDMLAPCMDHHTNKNEKHVNSFGYDIHSSYQLFHLRHINFAASLSKCNWTYLRWMNETQKKVGTERWTWGYKMISKFHLSWEYINIFLFIISFFFMAFLSRGWRFKIF